MGFLERQYPILSCPDCHEVWAVKVEVEECVPLWGEYGVEGFENALDEIYIDLVYEPGEVCRCGRPIPEWDDLIKIVLFWEGPGWYVSVRQEWNRMEIRRIGSDPDEVPDRGRGYDLPTWYDEPPGGWAEVYHNGGYDVYVYKAE